MTQPRGRNPYLILFGIICSILLNSLHVFAQSSEAPVIGLVPFISYVPLFMILASWAQPRIFDMYLFCIATMTGVGLLTAVRYHIHLIYGFFGGALNGLLFPTLLIPIWVSFSDVITRSVAVICTWTCIECVVTSMFGTAVTLPIQVYRVPFILQPISIFGTSSLDALLIASNWLMAVALVNRGRVRKTAAISFGVILTWWLLVSTYCWYSLESTPSTTARVSTLSPGYRFKGDLSDMVNMTREAFSNGAQFIVWPEVYVYPTSSEESCEDYVKTSIVPLLYPEINATVVIGCEQQMPNAACAIGNIAVTVGPEGSILGTYGKQHPVTMIGEKSCYRNGYRAYKSSSSNISFSTLICFDADFEDSTALVSDLGASLILTPSEDWAAARTHFAASVFRAIENRVAIAKSDWGWDSAIISPAGEILKMFNSRKIHRQILTADVPLYPSLQGGWNRIRILLFPAACLIVLGSLLIKSFKKMREQTPGLQTRLLLSQ